MSQDFDETGEGLFDDEVREKARRSYRAKNDITFNEERIQTLVRLYQHDEWNEELLSLLFEYEVEQILHPRERFIMEELVNGTSEEEIIRILKQSSPQQSFSSNSLHAYKARIKRKLKDGFIMDLPGWVRQQIWEETDEEEENLWK